MVENNFTKVPNKVLRNSFNPKLSAYEFSLLLYLLSHKQGYILSDVQITDELGYARKTIRKYKQELVDKNFISYKYIKNRGFIYSFNLMDKIYEPEIPTQMGTVSPPNKSPEIPSGLKSPAKSPEIPTQMGTVSPPDEDSVPTKNTNYNINYKTNYNTTKFSFEKIRERVVSNIHRFFDNDIDEVCKEIIDSVDSSFYKFRDYIPTDNELSTFLENNKEETLDNFNNYLYNGLVSESFLYNGKLIKPRIALLNNNKVRLNELLNIYYANKEHTVLNEESPFDKSPAFQEFVKQQQEKEPVKDKYSDLPEAEAAHLRALHSYDPPTEEELIDVHVGDFKEKEYEEYEATDEEIEAILREDNFDSSEDETFSEEEMDALIEEV